MVEHEHLRAWYQDFLGVRPTLDGRASRSHRACRRLPVASTSRPGLAAARCAAFTNCSRQAAGTTGCYSGLDATVTVDLPGLEQQSFAIRSGDQLVVDESDDATRATVHSVDGKLRQSLLFKPSVERRAQQDAWDSIFAEVGFATPRSFDQLVIRCTEPATR